MHEVSLATSTDAASVALQNADVSNDRLSSTWPDLPRPVWDDDPADIVTEHRRALVVDNWQQQGFFIRFGEKHEKMLNDMSSYAKTLDIYRTALTNAGNTIERQKEENKALQNRPSSADLEGKVTKLEAQSSAKDRQIAELKLLLAAEVTKRELLEEKQGQQEEQEAEMRVIMDLCTCEARDRWAEAEGVKEERGQNDEEAE